MPANRNDVVLTVLGGASALWNRPSFLMACPAGSSEFACCGYMVLVLASNCPMDCSYCFLQEYLADNPGFQVYANYADAFDELERARRRTPGRAPDEFR